MDLARMDDNSWKRKRPGSIKFIASVGLGFSSNGSTSGFTSLVNISNLCMGLSYNSTSNNLWWHDINENEQYEHSTDINALIGFCLSDHNTVFTLSSGLGINRGVKRGDYVYTKDSYFLGFLLSSTDYYKAINCNSINIPIDIKMLLRRFGFEFFANINSQQSNVGMLFSINFKG